ncbi:tRNA 2-selenouridine synthase [Cribrihabitans marinus]|uniref:tRNA 2-selenouridine synthase n=1 Tax=Cribrihabitans marinus TaxID=1227549 RepID=A0A1H7B705_9RHOB|nr:tRNA 2-selenouridine(34) synthase MnmH [Cribrihabitans marinus]GGH32740.1 tRNA 2-selenouridine synthase [Cribrihabitans marinus]SEJ70242.1 tRNA 2-selenouridine synthase [Cribrihabitans marinus]
MALTPHTLAEFHAHGFDTVIDVRSPSEFAEDHVPGAINLPVLDDEERARVGTIYVQESPFLARKLGAALIFRNAAHHLETRLSDHDGGWRPLVYCWRGGQRSGAFAWMLQQIGWRAEVVQGGYRSYRRLVKRALYDDPLPHRLVALDGNTGTAKTEILGLLRARGVQVVDLEGLANHRGSLLGERPGGQPAQRSFESALAQALCGLDPERPVVVEAESSKIGALLLPPSLWAAMKTAPRIEVGAPLRARGAYLARAYDDILSDADRLRQRLEPLRAHRGHAVVDGWNALIDADDRIGLTCALMAEHYDPAYAKSRRAHDVEVLERIGLNRLDPDDLARGADRIAALLAQL